MASDPRAPQSRSTYPSDEGSGQYGASYPTTGAPPQPRTQSNTLSIIAIVLGAVAIVFVPIVFGLIGIVLGVIAKVKGERLSTWGIVVPIVGMIAGIILGLIVYESVVR
jgi:cytochrome c biogenesis protein CcdA